MTIVPPLVIFLAVSAVVASAVSAEDPAPAWTAQELTPALTDEPLVNPGMGLYLYGTPWAEEWRPEDWYTPLISVGYFRDDWSVLQPDKEGEHKFKEYFEPIFDLWVKGLKKRVSFRFMSENMHSKRKYATPKWVFDAGVPAIVHQGLYAHEDGSRDTVNPPFWNEQYLAIQERFIADLGKYLDGREGLEFIDIGCIGQWGEMHLQLWTAEELERTGFTREKYIAAYRRIIDAFARAFPHTRVFLNIGDYAEINDYAAIRGQHFRQDGLTPAGASYDVGNRFFRPYSRRGVQSNYELCFDYEEMKRRKMGVPETFARGLEDPISYFHVNLSFPKQFRAFPDDAKKAVLDAARRVGYRFIATHVKCSQSLRLDAGGERAARLLIEHDWKNTGVAPCFDSYALRWSLVDEQGKAAWESIDFPSTPTTQWWPGDTVKLQTVLRVPPSLAAGRYTLAVAMVKPEEPALRIQLGLAGRDAETRYPIATLPAEKVALAPATAYAESFEENAGSWVASPGMTATLDADAQAGKSALLISGTQPGNAWNYASHPDLLPLIPSARYRLSCQMKVTLTDSKDLPPCVKLGVHDAAGKWLTNFNTNNYDLSKLGTWQRLETIIETPPQAAKGMFAIEKNGYEVKVKAAMLLDDVKLEVLERP